MKNIAYLFWLYFIGLLALAMLLISYGCTHGKWSKGDIYRQAGVIAISTVDYAQTMQIAANPDEYHEKNPILGEHPSQEWVTTYFLGSMLLHTAVVDILPPDYRPWFQYFSIGFEAVAVGNNFSIGLGIPF